MLTTSESILHNKIKTLVGIERKTLSEIIENLQRVYDTRLFAKMGHSSLIKYLIKEHGYSESAAYRRFQALKLTKEIPEIKQMISSGSLNLSGISKLQTMLKFESTDTKKQAIDRIQNKTTFETESTLFDYSPLMPEKKESKQRVSKDQTRLSITLSNTAMTKLDQLKARTKCYDSAKLIEQALELLLDSTDVTKTRTNKSKGSTNPRTITAQVKKEIYLRSNRKCEHPGCEESHNLEFDHIKPVTHGGTNEKNNIRLVCKGHNQLYAIQILGREKMGLFLVR